MTEQLDALADEIWGYAETGFLEEKSAHAMIEVLKQNGFTVETGIADMPTAYLAVYGSGSPVISFLCEYDALYSMNQKADADRHDPITSSDDTGHGCGHHLLGTGSIYAAILYKNKLQEQHLSGTIKVFGCPAEESGSGKAYLARSGLMEDTDIALTWHPSNYNQVVTGSSQSCISVFYRFHGVSSHAAGCPELGRSALDACELMNVGVNYLREHMTSLERVHYAYLNAGGKAPNVIPSEAVLKYFIRSDTNPHCMILYKRVNAIAEGAAMMTGTSVEILFDEGLSNTVTSNTVEQVLAQSFRRLGPGTFTEEELAYAQKYRNTADEKQIIDTLPQFAVNRSQLEEEVHHSPINISFVENTHSDLCEMGSTDVGDISWIVPTGQINTACYSFGAGAHTWQWVAQGKSFIAHKGYQKAGEILADAAFTFHEHPELIAQAKEELRQKLHGEVYKCLIPEEIKPHVSTVE